MPSNLGNQPWVLSNHERQLDVESELVVHYIPPVFGYRADHAIGELGDDSDAALTKRTEVALRAPLEYDVLHSYYGRSLFSWDDLRKPSPYPFLDLKIARGMGKKVFLTFQGCDVRMAARSNVRNPVTCCAPGACTLYRTCVDHLDAKRVELIDTLLPLADKVFYLNPELGHYLPHGEFLPYASVEIGAITVTPPSSSGRIRVVHAPSNRSIKGTDSILAALDIVARQQPIDIVLIENLSHEEAMLQYRSADLVIDQILAGWYGGFAVEVMAMGKIVLCALRERDFVNLPRKFVEDLPIVNVDPASLVEDLLSIINRRSEWQAISRASRRFVERWHDPALIAQSMIECYKDPSKPFVLP
ncbi:MAG: hypothetical protein EKK43_13745 [Methylobacterium sp.]|uniref:glycosyltransferase n=1 Tax=Methylobacterium sp. TaxID=409 RepID=UPI000FB27EB5|nr:hypothetical protein [Methylobacterium sp.]RUP14041.1 MAG: hypothetical protein EKK43_13745 [Methylobacterium sp.]